MTREERELAIDIFEDNFTVIDTHGHYTEEEECLAIDMAIQALEQEPKIGHWNCGDDMFEYAICSSCKHDTGEPWEYAKRNFKYCPNCGARMESEET